MPTGGWLGKRAWRANVACPANSASVPLSVRLGPFCLGRSGAHLRLTPLPSISTAPICSCAAGRTCGAVGCRPTGRRAAGCSGRRAAHRAVVAGFRHAQQEPAGLAGGRVGDRVLGALLCALLFCCCTQVVPHQLLRCVAGSVVRGRLFGGDGALLMLLLPLSCSTGVRHACCAASSPRRRLAC